MTYTLTQLTALSTHALVEFYRDLDAPTAGEMNGEYTTAFPHERDSDVRGFFRRAGLGDWLGKAYQPTTSGGTSGAGHNLWRRKGGQIIRSERFTWTVDESAIDGRDALIMRYSSFRNFSGSLDLIDEVRVAGPGLYIGIYTTRVTITPFTRFRAAARTRPEVFLLADRRGDWVGPDDSDAETGSWSFLQSAIRTITSVEATRPAIGAVANGLSRLAMSSSAPTPPQPMRGES
jgi:hypothetical protein